MAAVELEVLPLALRAPSAAQAALATLGAGSFLGKGFTGWWAGWGLGGGWGGGGGRRGVGAGWGVGGGGGGGYILVAASSPT